MLFFPRAMASMNLLWHGWEKEREIFEDIRVEKASFRCNVAEGSECQFYQFKGQCGLMNVYLPYFCACVQPAAAASAKHPHETAGSSKRSLAGSTENEYMNYRRYDRNKWTRAIVEPTVEIFSCDHVMETGEIGANVSHRVFNQACYFCFFLPSNTFV